MISDVGAERGQNSPIELFHLTIGLTVVRNCERVMHVEDPTHVEKELRSELFPVIGDKVGRRAVREHPMGDECARNRACGHTFEGDGFHELRESVDDDQYVLVSARRSRKFSKDVYTDRFQRRVRREEG